MCALRLFTSLVFLMLVAATTAGAQARPSTTLLRTHVGQSASEATALGFDRVLRQRLDALDLVTIAGSVELDLEAVQLALGCMGETVECLRAAASQTESEILVFGSLEAVGTSIVVSVIRFDATAGTLRRSVRTVGTEAEALATAEPIVRELWDLPSVDPGEGSEPPPVVPTPTDRSLSPWPLVLVGIGGAALIAGAVVTGLGGATRDAYAASRPTTMAEVDATLALLATAEDQQRIGVILLAAGAAVGIAGAVWALAAGNQDGSSPLAVLAPVLAPGHVGLVLAGSFGGGGS